MGARAFFLVRNVLEKGEEGWVQSVPCLCVAGDQCSADALRAGPAFFWIGEQIIMAVVGALSRMSAADRLIGLMLI
jgi:hypothetical protein